MATADKFMGYAIGELTMGKKGASIVEGSVHWNANAKQSLYGRMFNLQDYWCAMYVSWCAKQSGVLGAHIPSHFRTTDGKDWFEARGRWTTDRTKAKRGDLAYFKIGTERGEVNHVGIVEQDWNTNKQLLTIDGNTSSRLFPGSEDTGGCVARKNRTTDNAQIKFKGLGKTHFDQAPITVPPGAAWELPIDQITVGLTTDGYWGKMTTRFLQKRFGTYIDGEIWGQYVGHKASNPGLVGGWKWENAANAKGSPRIKAMQIWLGVGADGVAGPTTFKALQARLGKVSDGAFWGPSPAIAELQRRLSRGTL